MYSRAANINIDDSVLVQQSQRGDATAMERLILRYQNRIYNVILKICGNPDDAAELAQETFVKVIESIDKFQGKSSFYTWLFRIAVNLTLNHCQRSSRTAARSLDAEDTELDGTARQTLRECLSDERAVDPAAVAQSRELCELAKKCLLQLEEPQRAVVVLRDIEGMDYAQIADVLNLELGTVRSRLSRARSSLRDILEAMLK
ncbi:MAG TPA: sigma-70 family RNA polymerase sigma factor [Sedimentisphaerales bacterium]|nr:sigma-70 family RNA polymerase sigma factor [Phycisphaerae bacterium]HON90381.1 sigma-70 family RNA polymerase sigma factor [Sedimentisphaerales bacterium]HOV77749.1 sigma-70 family RNA polymerase sigma factor [Sedimentisphaerales bacterium]